MNAAEAHLRTALGPEFREDEEMPAAMMQAEHPETCDDEMDSVDALLKAHPEAKAKVHAAAKKGEHGTEAMK